ncbi:metal-dependent hydrolase [Gordonia sp. Z-3]|jgi:predicted metal-dependent hydrolase|uniref:metal-dependent hydrolase n=1 Tax=unclassified Gordonia (in: high G+C Gram-positive bacteria) TaxID=2657482 RepID=UPI000C444AC6|nr:MULTISPECIES: metal-dependent hydrolase [unclassified Gordonia (in: high G+C Gram-positive bacteria)]MAU80896.1 metal-dependent hydrolase [Gordonia sp. (in: high G+C Gram-positive bacteria)]MED5802843.1 metal-dependent hydrolase [Gordonia sp. Z-3]
MIGQPLDVDSSDPGPVELHARNVTFDWTETPLHWIPGHPVASNFISVLNLMLPEGERWFVQTYNEALPLVADDELAASMRGFIGQEAMHAEAHDHVLWEFLDIHGIDPRPYQRQMEWIFRKVLGPMDSGTPVARRKHLIERLWLIAALEHYTAILGDFALNNTWVETGADPAMTDLFTWHGAEEVEHRAVAHDVAVHFGDSYLRRGRAMLVVLPILLVLIHRGFGFIMKKDCTVHYNFFQRQYHYYRGVRAGVLPKMRKIVWATFSYFRPGFHPNEIGSTAQAVAYLAASPAARNAR